MALRTGQLSISTTAPLWHQDFISKLLSGVGKSINAYIALTEVNELNGFEYIPSEYLTNIYL